VNDANALSPFVELALAPWRLAMQASQAWPAALAPQNLMQPINTGWTFGNLIQVNEQNSTAPDTEQEIVRRHSYGRQIGRVMDAVDLLLEQADRETRADPRAEDFEALQREVADIKRERSAAQLRRLRDELISLRREQPEAWRELIALLREPA
jgi:hypothetical protein